MGVYLNPGNDAFQREACSEIYVDKTELIGYTNRVLGTGRSNICVSRPRRFGSGRTEAVSGFSESIDMNFDGLKDAVISMLGGGKCRINPEKFQNDMTSFADRDDVLTLLVHLGYLAYEEDDQSVFLPNMEIAGEFRNAIEGSKGWKL